MLLAHWSSRRQVGDEVFREAASAVLGDFDLAGRTALVSGSEADTVRALAWALWQSGAHVYASDAPIEDLLAARPPTPRGVDVLVHCCEDPRQTAALARCVVAANGRGAAIILQGMAPHRSAALRRASRELAALDIRLDVVQIPDSAQRALGAALGAVVFFAQRRRCS